MAKRKNTGSRAITFYEHRDKERVNNPPVGLVTFDTGPDANKTGIPEKTDKWTLPGRFVNANKSGLKPPKVLALPIIGPDPVFEKSHMPLLRFFRRKGCKF